MKKRAYTLLSMWIAMFLLAGCADMEEETEVMLQETTSEVMHSQETVVVEESQEEIHSSAEEIPLPLTMRDFLEAALLPVGNTMYVWGGGWNEEDTGAGPGATTIGLPEEWSAFASGQDSSYDYKEHKYEIMNGLDCSGYVGWVVYNLFEQENGGEGYVFKSTETAERYSQLGWGQYIEDPKEFLPGDIVSMKGHVWISLGMCEDGSVVVLHASPPGVSICGTPALEDQESQAIRLAQSYMEKYYPKWQEKFPNRKVNTSYLQNVTVMRWSEAVLAEAKVWQDMTAKEVLQELWKE